MGVASAGASLRRVARIGGLAMSLAVAVACPLPAQTLQDVETLSVPSLPGDPSMVAEAVAPAVVQVIASRYESPAGSGVLALQRLVASGVAIDRDGYVLTSARVIADARQIDVVIPASRQRRDGASDRVVTAVVVGSVAELDIALLHVPVTLDVVPMASRDTQVGDTALTVAPDGQGGVALTVGTVVSSGAPVMNGSPAPYLITDGAGSLLGSPLVNLRGQLIGMAAAFTDEVAGETRATVAVPLDVLQAACAQMREGAAYRRGVVGLAAESVARPWSDGDLSQQTDLVVSAVASGLPAEHAGIRSGDVIVAVNRRPVESMPLSTLYLSLCTLREGQPLLLEIERGGQRFEVAPTAVSVPVHVASY